MYLLMDSILSLHPFTFTVASVRITVTILYSLPIGLVWITSSLRGSTLGQRSNVQVIKQPLAHLIAMSAPQQHVLYLNMKRNLNAVNIILLLLEASGNSKR